MAVILTVEFSNSFCGLIFWALLVKLLLGGCRKTSPMICNISSGNGLVSGNKPLPEPVLSWSMKLYGITRPQCADITGFLYTVIIFFKILPKGTAKLWGQGMEWPLLLYVGFMHFIINPLRAKFFRGNINIYLHFVSFLHIDVIQVLKIIPQRR